ncbi:MAG TPA: DnaB-like helicase C-terminal domain-containing protein [Urbifossiella sp.]|nr:DnaB-like helicase C-terminal domain-containing protein [Urbifossiella sp.]
MIANPEPIGVGPDDLADASRLERQLLAVCIHSAAADGYATDIASELVTAEDFAHHAHQMVYRAIIDLKAAGEPPTAQLLYAHLKRTVGVADLGPNPALWFADLLQETSAFEEAHVRIYAQKVNEIARRRGLKRAAIAIHREADAPGRADEVVTRCESILFAATAGEGRNADGPRDTPVMVRTALARIDARAGRGGGFDGIPTGFGDLDAYLAGLRAGQVVVIGARPSVGKTALALRIALNATAGGYPTLFFSMEMNEDEVMARVLSMRSGVPLSRIDQGRLTSDQAGAVDTAGSLLAEEPFYLDAGADLSPDRFASELRRAVHRKGVKLAVVDYLQLMRPTNPRDNRNLQVGGAARAVKLAAGACGIPVLLLAQLNREVEGRKGDKPRLSDLRDSGEIEQHANTVVFLHPQEEQGQGGSPKLIDAVVAKNRNGPKGDVTLQFTGECVRFDNLPRGPIA